MQYNMNNQYSIPQASQPQEPLPPAGQVSSPSAFPAYGQIPFYGQIPPQYFNVSDYSAQKSLYRPSLVCGLISVCSLFFCCLSFSIVAPLIAGICALISFGFGITGIVLAVRASRRYKVTSGIVLSTIGIILGCFYTFFFLISFTGDPSSSHYQGEYIDLSTEARSSILGSYLEFFSTIEIIEEDSYGRTMFIYVGNSIAYADSIYGSKGNLFAIIISQKTDKDYVYYYPDYNFILYAYDAQSRLTRDELLQYAFDPTIAADIEALKKRNDWEKPINNEKCVKVKVSRFNKEQDVRKIVSNRTLVSEDAKQKAYGLATGFPEDSKYYSFCYLASDKYDRHLYFFRNLKDDGSYEKSYVVIFNKDSSFDRDRGVIEIANVWDYQEDLKAFKEQNNWNRPPD